MTCTNFYFLRTLILFRVLLDFEFLLKAIKYPMFHIITFSLHIVLFSMWPQDNIYLVQEYFIFLCRWKVYNSAYRFSNFYFHNPVFLRDMNTYLLTAFTNETSKEVSFYILVICINIKSNDINSFSNCSSC